MPLTSLQELLAQAQGGAYAVCYCESWNLESLQAVIEAAEETGSPIVAGFNGGFLNHPKRAKAEALSFYTGFRTALERTAVPVAFLLNESTDLDQIREGIELGFNAVMPDNEGMESAAYRNLVRAVIAIAKPAGVFVEAQVGTLPTGRGSYPGHASLTNPELAREFVDQTGVDALAVSIGNVHILTEGKSKVDLKTLERIRERVEIPLVLHGGTSLAPETLQAVIRLGIAKINFGTCLKQAYLEAIRAALERYRFPLSPHEFLGIGGPEDIGMAGREAVKGKVRELLSICGSENKAAAHLAHPQSAIMRNGGITTTLP
jgi:ketose-bisphosphate aldolase